MAEYIEREAAEEAVGHAIELNDTEFDIVCDYIDRIPVADVAPVKHGKWIQTNVFECSECEYSFEPEGYLPFFNYCPCCGAKMDGGDPNDQM